MRRVLKILLRTVIVLVVLVVVLVVGAYIFREELFADRIAREVENALAEQLGGKWSVAKIEGDWINNLAVVGLRTEEAPPTGPLTRLECGRAEVAYHWRGLLGDEPLLAIKSVTVTNAVVDLDLTRPPAPAAPGDKGEPFDPADIPTTLPRLDIAGRVSVRTADGDISADGIKVASDGADRWTVAARVTLPKKLGPGGELNGAIRRAGSALEWTSATPFAGVLVSRAVHNAKTSVAVIEIGGGKVDVAYVRGGLHARVDKIDLARMPPWIRAHLPAVAGTINARATVSAFEPLTATVIADAAGVRYESYEINAASASVEITGGRIRITGAQARADDIRLDATGLVVDLERPYLVGDVERLDLSVPRLRRFAPQLDREASLVLRARGDGSGKVVVEEFVVAGEGLRLAGDARATLPENPALWRETIVDANFEGSVDGWTSPEYSFTGTVSLKGGLGGRMTAPVVRVAVDGKDLVVRDQAIDELAAQVRVDWPRVEVARLALKAGADVVRAQGAVDAKTRRIERCDYEVELPDLARTVRLLPDPPPLAGRVSGKGSLRSDNGGLTGTAGLDFAGLAFDGRRLGDGTVKLTARDDVFEVEALRAAGDWGSADATGTVDANERSATIRTLAADVDGRRFALLSPLAVTWGGGGFDAREINVAVAEGRVTGRVAWKDGLVAQLRGLDLEAGAFDDRLRGRLAFVLRAENDAYTLEVTAPEVDVEGYRGEVFVRAQQADKGIELDRLTVRAGRPLAIEGSASLPWRYVDGAFVRIEGEPRLSLEAKVSDLRKYFGVDGSFAELSIRGDADTLRVTARATDLAPNPKLVLAGDTWIELTADRARVVAAARSERNPVGDLVGELGFDRGLDWTDLDAWRRLVDEAEVAGKLVVDVPDLSVLRPFVEEDILTLAGRMRADLRLAGRLRDPEWSGKADVSGLACKIAGEFPALREGAGRVRLTGRALQVEDFRASLGHAPIGLAGAVAWDGPGKPRIDLKVVGENTLLARNPHLRLRADLDVAVTGPLDALRLAGDVRITDGVYTRPMELLSSSSRTADAKVQLFSVREGPISTMQFDLRVRTKEANSFRVRNNAVRGAFQVDLAIRGTGRVPEPRGRVQFQKTLVKLPFSSLKVDLGEVTFKPENPFAPTVDVQAHTRTKGYDLEVSIRGDMPELEVYVSSRPALSQEDALMLLTLGVTREQARDDGVGRTAMMKAASFLGQSLVSRMSGPSDPDERSFFQRFEFVIGRNISRSGADTIEGEFEITEKLYLRGERDRFDEYNMGVVWRLRLR